MQQDPLRQNVVAILRDGTIAGTGFFIDRDGSILTCFHVVGDIRTGNLTDQPLSIRFQGVDYSVECISCSFIPKALDIAVLRLVNRALPKQAMLLPLGKWEADSKVNRAFVSYGYKLTGTFDGMYARSTVSGRAPVDLIGHPSIGFLQLASEDLRRDEVGRGMSGAPVYHEDTNQIVGVIATRSRHEDKGLAVPLALPIDKIARVWSPVRVRLQQDEMARQIENFVATYKLELWLQDFIDNLAKGDLPEYSSQKSDRSSATIEPLRSRGLIYELFSYLKSRADLTLSKLLDGMLSKAYTEGSEIKFINRQEALDLVDNPYGPPYLLFDAPAGYGKTELLWEIEQHYLLKGWICCYIGTAQTLATALDLVQTLARSANLSRLLPTLTSLDFSGQIIGAMLKARVELARASGIMLLIDGIERLSDDERNSFRDYFLSHLIAVFTGKASGAQSTNLRIVLAGRYLSPDWKQVNWAFPLAVKSLKPFNYDIVLTAISNGLWLGRDTHRSWAAHLVHVTGGHPRCIAESLPLMESRQSVEEHFANHQKRYRDIVLPIIDEVRNSIPEHLREIFDRLSVFRRYNVRLLRNIIAAEVISYSNGAVKLEQELTSTYLVNRRNKFIQDEIVRRLLAIRLHWINRGLFLKICEQARDIYQADLQNTHSDPEDIMVEAIYQELQLAYYQSEQDIEARKHLREVFLGENGILQRYIRGLAVRSNVDDIKLNLKEMLAGNDNDWEFRYAVNFFLRSDHYTDEPFKTMMHHIDLF